MAKVKQPLEENGIHRAKMWEIMMYALNNTSTNTYMMVVGYISYFLILSLIHISEPTRH